MRRALVCALALPALLAACASGPDRPKPAPLSALAPRIEVRPAWTQRIEGVAFPLSVAVHGTSFTVAGSDGTLLALQADTGRELWRASAGAKLAAGIGSDGRIAAVVTRDNELLAFEAGQLKWRLGLPSRVTSAPLVAGERVFVLATDRSVHAFDALDGRRLWSLQRAGDPLTLSQSGVLLPFKDTLVVGQGPRLAGLDPLKGTLRWEVAVATPRGTNEIERLADLVGPAARVGDMVCARAFQSAVGCVDAERGSLAWSRNAGGNDGIAADEQYVFGADASDRITAWRRAGGEVAWSSEELRHRGLSGPLVAGRAVVFGDAEGTLHFLSRDKGEALARVATDGSAVVAPPVRLGATLLAVTRSGGLHAFRTE